MTTPPDDELIRIRRYRNPDGATIEVPYEAQTGHTPGTEGYWLATISLEALEALLSEAGYQQVWP